MQPHVHSVTLFNEKRLSVAVCRWDIYSEVHDCLFKQHTVLFWIWFIIYLFIFGCTVVQTSITEIHFVTRLN